MLSPRITTHAVARHNNKIIVRSLERPRRRAEAIHALPSPMPRIKAINTTAKDWSDGPKINASDREDNNSNPMETAPVSATRTPAQRRVPGEASSTPA